MIYYYCIVLICLLLLNVFAMPWLSERRIQTVDYNTFITMTEKHDVGQVSISNQENSITFTDKRGIIFIKPQW